MVWSGATLAAAPSGICMRRVLRVCSPKLRDAHVQFFEQKAECETAPAHKAPLTWPGCRRAQHLKDPWHENVKHRARQECNCIIRGTLLCLQTVTLCFLLLFAFDMLCVSFRHAAYSLALFLTKHPMFPAPTHTPHSDHSIID